MRTSNRIISFLLATSAISAVSGGIANAQDSGSSMVLEEVIVTAEKRETNLQKTAAAVNVVTAQQLNDAAITRVEDIQSVIPGVDIYANANSTGAGAGSGSRNNVTIRGVAGATGGDPSTQPSVAMLVDGVYSQSGGAGVGGLYDLARVEVLKGPQGTLYGRNATVGVINIITQRPTFDNRGEVNVDVGNYSRVNVNGVVNYAIRENLAIRAAGQVSRRDGYYDDGLSNQDTYSGRLKVLYEPHENMSLYLIGDYTKDQGLQNGTTLLSGATGDPIGNPYAANLATGNDATNFYSLYFQGPPRNNENYGVTGQFDWGLGFGDLTVLAAYRRSLNDEVGPTYIGTINDSRETSLEVRLASSDPASRLNWLVGAFYYNQDLTGEGVTLCSLRAGLTGSPTSGGALSDYDLTAAGRAINASSPCGNTAAFPTTTAIVATGRNNQQVNYSVFTQDTFAVTDRLRLTGGARWQYEEAVRGSVYDQYYSGATPTVRLLSGRAFGQKDWTAVTWKAGVEFDVGPQSMAYAVVSTGWKAGTPLQYEAPYDEQRPEQLKSYTLGIKNRFLDNRLQVNGELYYWDFRDRQINQTVQCVGGSQNQVFQSTGGVVVPVTCLGFLNPPNGGVFVQGNAKKSHVQGASLDATFRLTQADTLSAAVEWIDESIHDDMGGQLVNGCARSCEAANAPDWSATFSYRRDFKLSNDAELAFDARAKVETRKLLAIAAVAPTQLQDGYTQIGAGLSYKPADGNWFIRGYVENLTDEEIKTQADAPGAGQTTARGNLQAPRTYGLQLRVDF